MGSSVTFPDGTQLVSSALTPKQVENIFQPLVAQMLGFDPVGDPTDAFFASRVGWQTYGQPSWGVTDNLCVTMATTEDEPFARVRDDLYEMTGSPADILQDAMGFTQVWRLRFVFYGSSGANWARQLLSSMSLDWVSEALQASNLYVIPEWHRPQRVPELHPDPGGVWYERTDVELSFNEQVSESLTPIIPAETVDVALVTDSGLTATFEIGKPATVIESGTTWQTLQGAPWSTLSGIRW